MKNTSLLLLCCALLGNVSAQTFAYNFLGDFENVPSAFIRKADGRFLIAGTTGGTITSGLNPKHYSSKGYFLDWDAEEGLKNSKQFEIYGETRLLDILELPNGNIITAGWDYICSNITQTLIYVNCFDPAGNLLWARYTDTLPQLPSLLNINKIQLQIRPGDGNVAMLFSQNLGASVKLLNSENGKTLYKIAIPDNCPGMAVNPINNNLVIINSHTIFQFNPDTGTEIALTIPNPITHRFGHVLVDAAGTIWAIADNGTITKWTMAESPISFGLLGIWGGIHWVAHGSGYAVYRQNSTGDKIQFYDSNFQLQNVIEMPDLGSFKVKKMYLDTNTIFLAGYEEHGSKANVYGSYSEQASSNLLIRRFGYDGLPKETEDPDLAVSDVAVVVQPVFTTVSGSASWKVWEISGGKFALTIRNNGNVPVNEAHILSSMFGFLDYDSSCVLEGKRYFSLHLQNLNLAPGAETVVTTDFINIVSAAAGSGVTPWTPCFWTAAPDQRRDVDFTNDYFCLTFWDTVPTEEPLQAAAGLSVFPNPATESIQIVLSEASGNLDTYRIFSISGKVMQQGVFPTGAGEFSAEIGELPAGVYFVGIGGAFGRFVKL